MAQSNFDIPFTQSPKELLASVKSTIKSFNGTFNGDTSSGGFKIPIGIGDIEGQYTIAGSVIKIDITKKPLLVSNKAIEKKLRSYLVPKAA
jgi:hypothetical protein